MPATANFDSARTTQPSAEEGLQLDAHTLKDLEVFVSDTGGNSLFKFCNLTQTEGGSLALRQRMERPWSDVRRIRATQDSLVFILKQRQAFTKLPAYTARRVGYYSEDILPMVTQANPLEFTLGAISLRATHNRHYFRLALGVQTTCALIRALRVFLEQQPLSAAAGELAPLLSELRELLARSRLASIPNKPIGSWAWRILRLDQSFRMYEKVAITRLVQIIYEIDALIAMADVTHRNDFIMPSIETGTPHVYAQDLKHPFVHNAVANPVKLDHQHNVLFLTGPNMAGKTTYIRAFAIAVYLAHLGMGVPASSFSFVPIQRLFSSISLSDDLLNGVSYFQAEALRIKAVAQAIAQGYSVIALMDEPFKGTNFKDSLDASLAILQRFAKRKNSLFMFSSHLIELGEELKSIPAIDCCYFEAKEDEGQLGFDYLLRPGVSTQRLGMRVLREEGVFALLDVN